MFGNQPADRIEPGGEETSDVAAEDNVVVEDHMQIIDDDSQMFQIGVPDRTIVRGVLLKSEKESSSRPPDRSERSLAEQ